MAHNFIAYKNDEVAILISLSRIRLLIFFFCRTIKRFTLQTETEEITSKN